MKTDNRPITKIDSSGFSETSKVPEGIKISGFMSPGGQPRGMETTNNMLRQRIIDLTKTGVPDLVSFNESLNYSASFSVKEAGELIIVDQLPPGLELDSVTISFPPQGTPITNITGNVTVGTTITITFSQGAVGDYFLQIPVIVRENVGCSPIVNTLSVDGEITTATTRVNCPARGLAFFHE